MLRPAQAGHGVANKHDHQRGHGARRLPIELSDLVGKVGREARAKRRRKTKAAVWEVTLYSQVKSSQVKPSQVAGAWKRRNSRYLLLPRSSEYCTVLYCSVLYHNHKRASAVDEKTYRSTKYGGTSAERERGFGPNPLLKRD